MVFVCCGGGDGAEPMSWDRGGDTMLALGRAPRVHGWGARTDADGDSAGTGRGLGFQVWPGVGSSPVDRGGRATMGDERPSRDGRSVLGNQAMDMQPERARFGPYRLLRTLDGCPSADRLLALHEQRQTSHVVYRFGVFHDSAERRRFIAAVSPLASLEHPHLLPVEGYSFAADGRGWAVTPYTGSQIGLMSLCRLLEDKGGRMPSSEVERALTHTLEGAAAGHAVGLAHGAITLDEVLIDRRGSASIELYGYARRMAEGAGLGGDVEAVRAAEVRSIVAMGYRLLTGMEAGERVIAASRVVKRLDRRWDGFFARGLEVGAGFGTAVEALAALPGAGSAGVAMPERAARGVGRRVMPMWRPGASVE